jgi:hypothetical protein
VCAQERAFLTASKFVVQIADAVEIQNQKKNQLAVVGQKRKSQTAPNRWKPTMPRFSACSAAAIRLADDVRTAPGWQLPSNSAYFRSPPFYSCITTLKYTAQIFPHISGTGLPFRSARRRDIIACSVQSPRRRTLASASSHLPRVPQLDE